MPVGRLSASPLPFSGRVLIHFSLTKPASVGLEVFDIGGRRVRRLSSAWFSSGANVLVWDGRGEGGTPVPAGVYTARLAGLQPAPACRLVRVR